MNPSSYIFLSPHPDDVAFSCGGLVWQFVQSGVPVEIWTVCAADPPDEPLSPFAQSLHERWGVGREALAVRRAEDIASCKILGAGHRHFEMGDCIYRRHPETGTALYDSEAGIFSEVHEIESERMSQLADDFRASISAGAQIVCPLGLGNHVDHAFTRIAAEKLGLPLWYYLDYPYVLQDAARIAEFLPPYHDPQLHALDEQALAAWQDGVAVHQSQISTFWSSDAEMRAAIDQYHLQFQGVVLYKSRAE